MSMPATQSTQIQMKTIKVCDATSVQLDWLVATIEGVVFDHIELSRCKSKTWLWLERDMDGRFVLYTPTTDWSQGGPLFSDAGIGAYRMIDLEDKVLWGARSETENGTALAAFGQGGTELIAKARCFVSRELGDTAEVPETIV